MGRKAKRPAQKEAEPIQKVEPKVEPQAEPKAVASGVEVQLVVKKEAPKETGWVQATPKEVLDAEKAGTLVGYDPAKGLAKFK